MDVDASFQLHQSYTILRIKRKRNDEPLDALVVESRVRRKKSRGGVGVFQYAQTVENDAWQDAQRQKDIEEKISQLARESALKADSKTLEPVTSSESSPSMSRLKEEVGRRYTIVERGDGQQFRKYLTSPPKVIAAKDLPPKTSPDSNFKLYDAILQSEKRPKTPEPDSEMDKFLPMLQDYLKINHIDPSSSLESLSHGKPLLTSDASVSSIQELSAQSSGNLSTASNDDYVWDVFYHRPATLSEWNEAANVGTLTGLPPSFGDAYDSASDSEEEDEADEDSNAEEYYKNDYPEDDGEGSSGDEFHEDSGYDDMVHHRDDADELW